jgi:two-component system nitrogen regulation sensor histidine kinase NtrY
MVSSFRTGISIRLAAFSGSILVVAWMLDHTHFYLTTFLCIAAAIAQAVFMVRFVTKSHLEVARFLEAIAVDDVSQNFSGIEGREAHPELGFAISRALARLRLGRSEREARMQYLQTLVDHAPVALLSTDDRGKVQLLNIAARRLFGRQLTEIKDFLRNGTDFAAGMQSLSPGRSAILRMMRGSGSVLLKVAATGVIARGVRHNLVSLQNIGHEMTAQEMAAWQTVIRVMTHEVTNSLTPVSSLANTAHDLVRDVLADLPPGDPHVANLADAREALETMADRSQGLLHFVENHRRLTRRLETQLELTSMRRVFARLQRLLGQDLAGRGIQMTISVDPETLDITVDPSLLDQALINLVRNAIEALRETQNGFIVLSAFRDADGHVTIAVTDNGPGIPSDQQEKVFVPFYTTKRLGSGIGLTIVRQIATAHGATVEVAQAARGGAIVSLRF